MCLNLKLFRIAKQNIVNITSFFVFIFLSGCSLSIPEPDKTNQTLLIIPVETIQTLRKFIFTVNLAIQDSSLNRITYRIEPNPDVLFSYKSKLKPGKYKITRLNLIAKPGFRIGKKKKLRISNFRIVEFQLEKGKATILEKKLLIQQPERVSGLDMKNLNRGERKHEMKIRRKKLMERNKKLRKEGFRHVKMEALDDSFKEKLLDELEKVENIEKWEIVLHNTNNLSKEKSTSP